MSHETVIRTPELADLLFIDKAFQTYRDNPDTIFYTGNIENLTKQHVAAVHGLSDEVFFRLSSILDFASSGQRISGKETLSEMADKQLTRFSSHKRKQSASRDMEAFILLTARVNQSIDWRAVASLYNRSHPDDQAAIAEYFEVAFDLEIPRLLNIKAPDFAIPEAFIHHDQAVPHGDSLMVLDEKSGKWLKDFHFHQQLKVRAHITVSTRNDTHTRFEVLGAAGHLDTALAIANACVLKKLYVMPDAKKLTLHNICIIHDNKAIAQSDYVNGGLIWQSPPGPEEILSLQREYEALTQQVAQLREESQSDTVLNLIAERASIANKIHRFEESSRYFSREEFNATRLSVEEAMGIQWGKVHDLEVSLGI